MFRAANFSRESFFAPLLHLTRAARVVRVLTSDASSAVVEPPRTLLLVSVAASLKDHELEEMIFMGPRHEDPSSSVDYAALELRKFFANIRCFVVPPDRRNSTEKHDAQHRVIVEALRCAASLSAVTSMTPLSLSKRFAEAAVRFPNREIEQLPFLALDYQRTLHHVPEREDSALGDRLDTSPNGKQRRKQNLCRRLRDEFVLEDALAALRNVVLDKIIRDDRWKAALHAGSDAAVLDSAQGLLDAEITFISSKYYGPDKSGDAAEFSAMARARLSDTILTAKEEARAIHLAQLKAKVLQHMETFRTHLNVVLEHRAVGSAGKA
jgi:hypothetical protein